MNKKNEILDKARENKEVNFDSLRQQLLHNTRLSDYAKLQGSTAMCVTHKRTHIICTNEATEMGLEK